MIFRLLIALAVLMVAQGLELNHNDFSAIQKAKKMDPLSFNTTESVHLGESASRYENDPFGYSTLYHSEVAYCVDTDYMSRDYNTNSYTKSFVPTLYVHSDNTQQSVRGYIGYQPSINAIIVSFRGSEDLANWVTNLDAVRMNYGKCSGCSVHEGFYKAEQGVYSTVYDEVSRLVNEYPSYQIVVTGHSLGAALATLTALDLVGDFGSKVNLYNYGCPRLFNQAAADWSSSGVLNIGARRTHYKDIVVHSPPYAMGFRHTDGEIYENGPSSNWPNFPGGPLQDCVGEEDDSCADQFDIGSISDHLLYSGFVMGTNGCDQL